MRAWDNHYYCDGCLPEELKGVPHTVEELLPFSETGGVALRDLLPGILRFVLMMSPLTALVFVAGCQVCEDAMQLVLLSMFLFIGVSGKCIDFAARTLQKVATVSVAGGQLQWSRKFPRSQGCVSLDEIDWCVGDLRDDSELHNSFAPKRRTIILKVPVRRLLWRRHERIACGRSDYYFSVWHAFFELVTRQRTNTSMGSKQTPNHT